MAVPAGACDGLGRPGDNVLHAALRDAGGAGVLDTARDRGTLALHHRLPGVELCGVCHLRVFPGDAAVAGRLPLLPAGGAQHLRRGPDEVSPYKPFYTVYENIDPNPIAAMPSLHVAFPMYIALSFIELNRGPARWAALLYPLAVTFSVVYLGHHYVIDCIAGVAYALVFYWLTWKAPEKYGDGWSGVALLTRYLSLKGSAPHRPRLSGCRRRVTTGKRMNFLHRRYCNSDEWAEALQRWILPGTVGDADLGDSLLEVGPGPGKSTDWLRSVC